MIDDILSLLDRAVSLLKIRAENRRRIYDNHVEPLFTELLAIHNDYNKMFLEVEEMVSGADPDLAKTREWLAKRRRELLPIRQKVTTLAHAIQDSGSVPSVAHDFVKAVCSYFSIPSGNEVPDFQDRRSSAANTLIEILDFAAKGARGDFDSERMKHEVNEIRMLVERRWKQILEAYAKARIESLK